MFRSIPLLASLLSLRAAWAIPTDDCPILGPTYLPATNFADREEFLNATTAFPETIRSLFDAGIVNETHSTFVIDVFSTETNNTIYSYYHSGSGLEGLTVPEANDGTIFRVGSVTKLFTAYAIVAAAGLEVFNHPVTRYLPELAGNAQNGSVGSIIWEDINVGALLAHQAGTGGVPIEAAICYGNPDTPCTPADFLNWMRTQKRPVIQPWAVPIYSDAGYATAGRLLERITGLPYEDSLRKVLFEPLGLNSSSTFLPPSEGLNAMAYQGAFPGDFATSSWGFDNELTAPSGGVYTNAADMRALGLSILHSELLSPEVTRQWMKPLGHTSSLTTSIGAPWEIFRLGLPVTPGSNRTRISDLYTKAGGQAGYGTVIALSPDHGIGYSVSVAGPTSSSERFILRDAIGETFIPVAEHAAVANAAENFAGVFVDPADDTTNLTLSIDADKPGVGLESWYVAGVEWRANLTAINSPLPSQNVSVRLYPNGFSEGEHVGFYGVPTIVPVGPRSALEGGIGLFENTCATWQSLGFWVFGGLYPEEFWLTIVDGRLQNVTNVAAGVTMSRVE